jgi:hypothetical protein
LLISILYCPNYFFEGVNWDMDVVLI